MTYNEFTGTTTTQTHAGCATCTALAQSAAVRMRQSGAFEYTVQDNIQGVVHSGTAIEGEEA